MLRKTVKRCVSANGAGLDSLCVSIICLYTLCMQDLMKKSTRTSKVSGPVRATLAICTPHTVKDTRLAALPLARSLSQQRSRLGRPVFHRLAASIHFMLRRPRCRIVALLLARFLAFRTDRRRIESAYIHITAN